MTQTDNENLRLKVEGLEVELRQQASSIAGLLSELTVWTSRTQASEAREQRLESALREAECFIEGLGNDLHNRRCADWYIEGANGAASSMSEDMRLLGNACADFDARQALSSNGETHE